MSSMKFNWPESKLRANFRFSIALTVSAYDPVMFGLRGGMRTIWLPNPKYVHAAKLDVHGVCLVSICKAASLLDAARIINPT